MKVKINKDGIMKITPETLKEDEQLSNWYKTNGNTECRKVIEFKRTTNTKELLECTVCWGGGKIEYDDFGNEEHCTWCNGTGLVSKSL